jgi:hypothetical protein
MVDYEPLAFGVGALIATPSGGSPIEFGVLQEVSLTFDATEKPLYGSKQYAVATAIANRKVTGKAKFASFRAKLFNAIFFNISGTTGQKLMAYEEAGTVPGSSTYTITVTNSAAFSSDVGVKYAATGKPLTKVASGPTAGQYSVSAGVYTFASADASTAMLLSYVYTQNSTGLSSVITNQLAGVQPTFRLDGYTVNGADNTKQLSYILKRCVGTKLMLPMKNDDWSIPDFEFTATVGADDILGEFNSAA